MRPDAERAQRILRILARTFGAAACELDHDGAFQLLVATILSAQSTPRQVNQVTPALFARYADARALADADVHELEALIRGAGFYRHKAKILRALAKALLERHAGTVPHTLGALCRLPGVTRTTANQVLGNFFGLSSGFIVDSNVRRVSRRLGLSHADDARGVERDLMALWPREQWKDQWIDIANELIWHGRRVCHVKEPACRGCALAAECPSASLYTPLRDDRPYPWGDGGDGSGHDR